MKRNTKRALILKLLFLILLCIVAWIIYLDARVRTTFEGRLWSLPAQIYARPLVLENGTKLSKENLLIELNMLDYKKTAAPSKPGEFSIEGDQFSIFRRAFKFPDALLTPQRIKFELLKRQVSQLRVASKHQQVRVIRRIKLDPLKIGGIYSDNAEERVVLTLDEIPDRLRKSIIAVEDRHFYQHHGVAFLAIARAMWANIRAGRVVQGGSTLTQQLVKNLFLSRERSYVRKLNEAMMAFLLEFHYDKDKILETYLNEIYFGQAGSIAIHGVGMASEFYFGVKIGQLTLAQQALLVGLIKGPGWYDPRKHPERARVRRNLVLSTIAKAKVIPASALNWAPNLPLGVIKKPVLAQQMFPSFIALIKQQLKQDYLEVDLKSKGLRIFSSLDPVLQFRAEHALNKVLNSIIGGSNSSNPLQGAIIVTRSATAEVSAVVGGRGQLNGGFNRALSAVRPIGSLVKPAVYLAALEQSDKYNLITPLNDRPFSLVFDNGEKWQPRNYSKQSHGDVPLHQALAHSYNLSTARLGLKVGVERVRQALQKLGVSRPISHYPSLLLGAISLTPFDVAKMYQTIASKGFNAPLRAIRRVESSKGRVERRYPYRPIQVLNPTAAYLLHYVLQEVMQEGTGKTLYQDFPKDIAVAGKTGTTNDLRDSWFAGYTSDWLAVAWVGKDDNGKTSLTGSSGALKVWQQTMKYIPQNEVRLTKPENIEYKWVDDQQEVITDEDCNGARWIPFVKGSEPKEYKSCYSGVGKVFHWFKKLF